MKISELTNKTGLSYSTDAANSYLIMNYLDQNEEAPVTYKINLSELKSGLALNNVDNIADTNKSFLSSQISDKGTANGVATLDANGKLVSTQLPLGTSDSTAYRGDYGAAAYAHAMTNKGSAYTSGLYKITTNSEGHIIAATAVEKSDITALGIPGSDTTYSSLTAAEDGSNESLVTTGEKYIWNNKYTKPSAGIPASDIADGVIPDISGLAPIDEPEFTTSITIGSTTLTEAQLQALLALLETNEPEP